MLVKNQAGSYLWEVVQLLEQEQVIPQEALTTQEHVGNYLETCHTTQQEN